MLGVLGLSLGRELGLTWLHSLLLLLPIVLVEAALRWLVNRERPRFEQELARLTHAGGEREIHDFIRSQRLLRFGAPRGYLQGKLAGVYRQFGQHRRAAEAFRQALEDAPAAATFPLALGLADSLFELGELAEAERAYRAALDEEHAPPRACVHLAQIIRKRGGSLEEAEAYLRRAVEQQPELRWRCELAALLVDRGKLDEAEWQLGLCDEGLSAEPPDSPVREQLAAIRTALASARTRPVAEPEAAPSRR